MRNIESIRLYRDVLKAAKHFTWVNKEGVPWNKILKENTRKEFEQARYEKDPMLIAQMIVVGRDCLNQTAEKYSSAAQAFRDNIDKTKSR